MTSLDFRRSIHIALAALDALDAALRAFREALTAVLASLELTSANTESKEVLSVSDVVARFKVKRRTVLEARRKGHLRGMKPPGARVILFELSAVQEWIAGRSSRLRVVR